ncbi:MAG: Gmad2 immunoglobulin-like domain-containing protein [Candidatus Gracilibacteria bacterium]|nr:Gmad2 immunoglobulin-like domain-containing protein [Candidatus Gracilibacteria bacterium]
MNRRTALLSIFSIIFFVSFIFLILRFSSIDDNWTCSNGSYIKHGNPGSINPDIVCDEANFSYTGTIESFSGDLISLKNMKGEVSNMRLSKDAVLLGIDQKPIKSDNILKGFDIEVSGKNIDNIRIIQKLSIIKEINIILYSPIDNEKVFSSLRLSGVARVFENTFNYMIKDSDGKIIKEGVSIADSIDTGLFGSFDVKIDFIAPTTETGSIEVFEYSAKDGSKVNMVIVPIIFGR